MSQVVYYYQVVPTPQYPHNQILNNSQFKDPTSIQGQSNSGQNAVSSDQNNMNNQQNEIYEQQNTSHANYNSCCVIQNPIQYQQINQYESRMMYCMPQYMQFYTNQNYSQQCYQILQARDQYNQIGLNSYSNQSMNYQNSYIKEICIQPTQCTDQPHSPHKKQSKDKQNLDCIFEHQDDTLITQNQQIKIDSDKSNYFKNQKIIGFDENASFKQGEVLKSERVQEQHFNEQDNHNRYSTDRSIIRKNVIQKHNEEEQASFNKQQPKNRGLFDLAKQTEIQSQSSSQNSINIFDQINILNGQNEKNLNSKIFLQQKWQKESIKQEQFYKVSADSLQKDCEKEIIKKKITFKQNFSPFKIEEMYNEEYNICLKTNQQNQQVNNFISNPDQLQIKNQNCAIVKKEDYEKQSNKQLSTHNSVDDSNEFEHFQHNLQKQQIQNEKITDNMSINIQKSQREQRVSVKQCVQRKLNSVTEIQNSNQKIEIIHKIHQQRNEASEQKILEHQFSTSKIIVQKCDQQKNNQNNRKLKKINEQQKKKQQQLSLATQQSAKNQANINGLSTYQDSVEIQPNIKIELHSQNSLAFIKNQTIPNEPNRKTICDSQKSNKLIDENNLSQFNNIFSQPVIEQQIQQQQQFSRNQDIQKNECLIIVDQENQQQIQKTNTDNVKNQAKAQRVIISKVALKSSTINNISDLGVLTEEKDQEEFQMRDIPIQNIQFQANQDKLCKKQQIQNKAISIENQQIKELIIDANQKEHQQEKISESPLEIEIEELDSQTDNCQRLKNNQQQQSISQEDENNQLNKVAIGNASKNILKAFQRYISNHEKSSQCTISSLNRMYQRNTLSNLLLIKIYLNQRYKKLMNEFIESYASDWLIQSKVQNLEIHLKILEELKNNNVSILKTKKKKYQRKKITEFNNQTKREKIQHKANTAFNEK